MSAGPRNRDAFLRGEETKTEIRALLIAHRPLAKPLSPKEIRPRLSRDLSESTIRYHLRAIRAEEEK